MFGDTSQHRPRWKEAMRRITRQMKRVEAEMSAYFDDRSERWQQSERAGEFNDRLEALWSILDEAQNWPD